MAPDSSDEFRIRLGRVRSRAGPADTRLRPFVKQVEAAIRKAGGNPNRIGGSAGKRSGRFNARGRGAKLSFPKGWRSMAAGFRRSVPGAAGHRQGPHRQAQSSAQPARCG